MKKIISILLSITFCLSLVACGSNGGSSSSTTKNDNSKYVGVYWDEYSNKPTEFTTVVFLLGDGTYKRGQWGKKSGGIGASLETINERYSKGDKPDIERLLRVKDFFYLGEAGSGSWWVVDENIIQLSGGESKMEITESSSNKKEWGSKAFKLIPGYGFLKEYIS